MENEGGENVEGTWAAVFLTLELFLTMSPPQLESFRCLGPSCVAGPVFLRRARQINSAYLRGALSLVGFIAVCNFIRLWREINCTNT